MGRTNVASGGSELNVFAQSTEPSKKDGIWIKTPEAKYKYDGINIINSLNEDTYLDITSIAQIRIKESTGIVINENIYIFGSKDNGSGTTSSSGIYTLKYNPYSDSFDYDSTIPYNFSCGRAILIENKVYLFGGRYGTNVYYDDAYVYNPTDKTYTRLTSIPYVYADGGITNVNSNIYLFGNSYSSYQQYAYKYNIKTNKYTKLTNIPFAFSGSAAVSIGNIIYLFYETNSYRYDTTTNKYTKSVNNPPNNVKGNAILTNNSIYLFNVNFSSSFKKIYKFIPYLFVNDYIYILEGNKYNVKLSNKIKMYFSKSYTCMNNTLQEYPCYYGDGTKWNLIE